MHPSAFLHDRDAKATRIVNTHRRTHLLRAVLIGSLLGVCWLGMQAVHEFGHVLHAWVSGGTVTRVVLHPLTISRTDVHPNPRPNVVTWGGPLWGSVLPLAAWIIARATQSRVRPVLAFFAGFCLIANGAYLGSAVWLPVGDAADLLHHGTPLWTLVLFALITIPLGLRLWNGLGRHFGLGADARPVKRAAAWTMFVVFVAFVLLELMN